MHPTFFCYLTRCTKVRHCFFNKLGTVSLTLKVFSTFLDLNSRALRRMEHLSCENKCVNLKETVRNPDENTRTHLYLTLQHLRKRG